MILEPFEKKHEEEIVALWNGELGKTFPMQLRLLQQNWTMDPRLLKEGSWVARDTLGGSITGFVASKLARPQDGRFGLIQGQGWISALLVASAQRYQGTGGLLLRKAEEALRRAGASRIALGNDLHLRMFPGIPSELEQVRQWFERRGYLFREEAFDLLKTYAEKEPTDLPTLGEASMRVAVPADRAALTEFMARCFPGTWDLQHCDYWERGGTGQEYVLLEQQGKLIGFCRMNTIHAPLLAQNVYWSPLLEGELGGVGPLGIDEAYRGHRYGLSIVQGAIHFLRARGVRHIVIDTTPFVDFYGKLGYTVWKSYAKYDKPL